MQVKIEKDSRKYLLSLTEKDRNKILEKINFLAESISGKNINIFNELDVKSLEGQWKGFLRMRIGKYRIIFKYIKPDEIHIYVVDARGSAYKK